MPKSPPAPLSIPLEQDTLDRVQAAASQLKLSVSAAVGCAAEAVATAIANGWRPRHLPPSGPVYLAFRLPTDLREKINEAASVSGIKVTELNRLSVWAALNKMEGRKQVLWPFTFTKKQLNEVVLLYSD